MLDAMYAGRSGIPHSECAPGSIPMKVEACPARVAFEKNPISLHRGIMTSAAAKHDVSDVPSAKFRVGKTLTL